MKRIAIIHGPLVMGGAEKSLINLLHLIDYSQYEVTLWLKDDSGSLRNQVDSRVIVKYWGDYTKIGYRSVLKHFKANREYKDLVLSLLRRALSKLFVSDWYKNYKYYLQSLGYIDDLVYDAAVSYHSLVREDLMILSNLIKSKAKIGWIHGACHHDKRDSYYKPYDIEYKKLDHIVCVSKSTEQQFLSLYPELEKKTTVIYNLQNAGEIKALAEEKIEENFEDITLVTVGRLSKEKGQDMIPAIAAELLRKGYDFHWLIVGEGELRTEIVKQIASYGVNGRVLLLGEKKNPYPYIKKATLYVQTSHTEGYCLTTLEAKVINTKVVTTDVPGMREQFENDSAVLCKDTVQSLVEGVEAALENQEIHVINENYWNTFNQQELQKFYKLLEG